MPTVRNQLDEYLKRPDAIRFGRKKIVTLGRKLADLWDTGYEGPIPYVYSSEFGKTFGVRNYPDYFTPIIDLYIQKLHDKYAENLRKQRLGIKSPIPNRPKRIRKKIPAFSGKPLLKRNA